MWMWTLPLAHTAITPLSFYMMGPTLHLDQREAFLLYSYYIGACWEPQDAIIHNLSIFGLLHGAGLGNLIALLSISAPTLGFSDYLSRVHKNLKSVL